MILRSHTCDASGARPRATATALAIAIIIVAAALSADAHAQPPPTPPVLLVATPDLSDPIFQQVVILLLPDNKSPLLAGVIINQPTTIPVKTLLPDAPARLGDVVAYFGGPVEMNDPIVVARMANAPAGATAISGDLSWIDDRAAVAAFLKGNPAPSTVRIYYGRAQWLPIQLRGEIQSGAWYVEPMDADAVFSTEPRKLWRAMVERGQLEETMVPHAGDGTPGALAALIR